MASESKLRNSDNGQLSARIGYKYQNEISIFKIIERMNDNNIFVVEFVADLYELENKNTYWYEIKNCNIVDDFVKTLKQKTHFDKNRKLFFITSSKPEIEIDNEIAIEVIERNEIINKFINKISELWGIKKKKINEYKYQSFLIMIIDKIFSENLENWKENKITNENDIKDIYYDKIRLLNSKFKDRVIHKDKIKNIINDIDNDLDNCYKQILGRGFKKW